MAKKKIRRKIKDATKMVFTNPIATQQALYDMALKGKDKIEDAISAGFHNGPRGVAKSDMLYTYDLDSLPKRDVERISGDLKNGAKVAFFSSSKKNDAISSLKSLGLDSSYASQVYLVCCDGHEILMGSNNQFASVQTEVLMPKRDENGNVELASSGVPLMQRGPRIGAFSQERKDKINDFKTQAANGGYDVEVEPVEGVITITGGDRKSQVYQARKLLDSLVLTPQEMQNYGINITKNGIMIAPINRSNVNADYTICALAGVKATNVRRSVANVGQINNPHTVASFYAMFVDEENQMLSADEASKKGIIDNIALNLFDPEPDFVTVDSFTRNGSWIQRWTPSNRKSLRELHEYQQDYVYRLNEELGIGNKRTVGQTAVAGVRNIPHVILNAWRGREALKLPETTYDQAKRLRQINVVSPLTDSIYRSMLPMFDLPNFKGKYSYAQRQEAVEKIQEAQANITAGIDVESNNKIIKENSEIVETFDNHATWVLGPVTNVITYLADTQENYKPKGLKGRISSFASGIIRRERMPDAKISQLPKYQKEQQTTFQQLERFNQYLLSIENVAERSNLSTIYTGFMLLMEDKMKAGVSQEEIFERINSFVNSHIKERTDTNDDTPVTPTPPSPTDENNNENRDFDEATKRQQYVDALVLKRSVEADQQMLDTIVRQYNGDEKEAAQDPSYIYFSNQLISHKQALSVYPKPEEGYTPANLDEKTLSKAIDYSINNTYITLFNKNIEKQNSLGIQTQTKTLQLYDVPEYLKKDSNFQALMATVYESSQYADVDTKLGSEVHNEYIKNHKTLSEFSKGYVNNPEMAKTFLSPVWAMVVENAITGFDANYTELLTAGAVDEKKQEEQKEEEKVNTDDQKLIIDAFRQFSYVPSVSLEKTNKVFRKQALKMTNEDLWMFNRYHKIITTGMEEYLASRGYAYKVGDRTEYGTMLQVLKELNAAFVTKEGLTQDKVTTYKQQENLKSFVKAYAQISKKYKNNPVALKQAKEIFLFEMDQARRLDIYRKSIVARGDGFTFRGKKAKTQDELLGRAFEEDLHKKGGASEIVLSLIQTTSGNVRDYNLFKFDVQTSFEATSLQFDQGILNPNLDDFRCARAFVGEAFAAFDSYLTDPKTKKNMLEGTKEYEIFTKFRNAWDIDPSSKAPKNALEKERELESFAKAYEEIENEYKDDPASLKRAQDMFMFCFGQARVVGEMFKEDSTSKRPWIALQNADKAEYLSRFKDQMNDDFNIFMQASNTATLICGINDVNNVAGKLPATSRLGETSRQAKPTGKKVGAGSRAKTEEVVKKKTAAKLNEQNVAKKPKTPSASKPKPKTKKSGPKKKEIGVDRFVEGSKQLIVSNGIIQAKNILKTLDKSDPLAKKLNEYIESAQKEFDQSIEQNGKLFEDAKKNPQALKYTVTSNIVTQNAYSMLTGNVAETKPQLQSIAQDVWGEIFEKQKKGEKLTEVEQALIQNTPMWQLMLDQKKLQVEEQKKKAQELPQTNTNKTNTNNADQTNVDSLSGQQAKVMSH